MNNRTPSPPRHTNNGWQSNGPNGRPLGEEEDPTFPDPEPEPTNNSGNSWWNPSNPDDL